MPNLQDCAKCIFDKNLKDKWQYLTLFLAIGLFVMLISEIPYFGWINKIGLGIISAVTVTLLWSAVGGDPISKQINKLEETVDTAGVIKETGLFRFRKTILIDSDGTDDFWYRHIKNANGDILLMSPKLGAWFSTNPRKMQECLLEQAINYKDRKIHFVIMGSENTTCSKLVEDNFTTRIDANIDFYRNDLRTNEEYITGRLLQVNTAIKNELIKRKIDPIDYGDYFIKAKKVVGVPIFLKVEAFGDILHWSFFGYNFSGAVAPSFWIDKKRSEELHDKLINEFTSIWNANKELVVELDGIIPNETATTI